MDPGREKSTLHRQGLHFVNLGVPVTSLRIEKTTYVEFPTWHSDIPYTSPLARTPEIDYI